MSLKSLSIFTGLAVVAATACSNPGQDPAQMAANSATLVSLDTVKTGDAVYQVQYPGTVVALKEVTFTSQVSGYVTGIYFKDGQHVNKGQKLYSIDAQVYDANVQNAKAQLAVQEANLEKAKKDADRYHLLDAQDAIAKQQVDYADAALAVAQKQVAAAKSSVAALNANVQFSTIYAPFSGTIGISNVRVGTAVVQGQTVLNAISTDNPMAVDFNIDQSELYRFEQMRQKGDALRNQTFSIAFDNNLYPQYGSIDLIDRAVDPQTGTVKIRLSFSNDQNLLKPGMSTAVRVKNDNGGKPALLIPHNAVIEQLGEFYVYKVTDSSTVTQQKILLGQAIGSNIIVTDGLSAGQVIVSEGQQKLREGAKITTGNTPEPKNNG